MLAATEQTPMSATASARQRRLRWQLVLAVGFVVVMVVRIVHFGGSLTVALIIGVAVYSALTAFGWTTPAISRTRSSPPPRRDRHLSSD
jgi:hypothetical protein